MTNRTDDKQLIDSTWLEAEGWVRDASRADRWRRSGVDIAADGPSHFCWHDARGLPTVLLVTRADLRLLLGTLLGP